LLGQLQENLAVRTILGSGSVLEKQAKTPEVGATLERLSLLEL